MAKVVRFHQYGGPEQLRVEEIPVGDPGHGQVRIRVEAIGLNRAEALFRAGLYLPAPQFPSLNGYEAAGVIEAFGAGVTGFSCGERVCVTPNFRLGEYGTYGERVILPASALIAAPPGQGAAQAAATWMQYLTALAILDEGHAAVGDYVIIRAASSSVGLAAIQLANWAGAVTIATTRTSAKSAALEAQGAQHVIATDEKDFVGEVRRITGGRGARIIFDPIGGPDMEQLAHAAADQGIILIYGALSGQPTPYPLRPAVLKGLRIQGWNVLSIWNEPVRFARSRDRVLRGLADGHLEPIIAKTFPLEQIVEAHRYLESNQHVGKIVVTV